MAGAAVLPLIGLGVQVAGMAMSMSKKDKPQQQQQQSTVEPPPAPTQAPDELSRRSATGGNKGMATLLSGAGGVVPSSLNLGKAGLSSMLTDSELGKNDKLGA